MRARLSVTAVIVALTSVLIATIGSTVAVNRALDRFGREDLALSADHTAAVAADMYGRDGGWSAWAVARMQRFERVQGHTLVLRDAARRVLPGSAPSQARERAVVPVRVRGRRVGEVSLAHAAGGYLRLAEPGSKASLTDELHGKLMTHDLVAGVFAAVVGLIIGIALAVKLSRPIERLKQAAERIEAGDLDMTADVGETTPELEQLGRSLERVSSTLREEDDVRRESIADLAHELRTPLTGLRARIEAAQDGVLTDLPAALAAMHSDALRLAHLTEDFELLAEAEQPGMLLDSRCIDMAELTRNRARAFDGYFEAKGVDFRLEIEPANAWGDAERIGQVVDNLISNALRYTDPGGRVTVRLSEGDAQSTVEVADTGIGIAAKDLSRIFDRFWRGEKSRSRETGGSGLGLALVRELVRAHEGRVDVHSVPGRGSRFRVHLPVGVPRSAPLVQFEERPDAGAPDGRRVCVARLARDLRPAEWEVVEGELLDRIRAGSTLVAFEIDHISALHARGITTLLCAQAQIRARGGRFMVVCPDDCPALWELRSTGADEAMTIVSDVDCAIKEIVHADGVGSAATSGSPH
jgi:signal transduction histidine kinase